MFIDLHDTNALVCGASQGIGYAAATELAKAGAGVTLLARNCERLETISVLLPNDGTQMHDFICSDIKDSDKIIQFLDKKIAEGRKYNILINNTGGPAAGSISEAKEQELREAFEMHVIASQIITKHLLPGMKETHYGRIINIISVGLKQPIANLGVSNTIRGAMGSWAKTLASEVAKFGITVNNILPGYTETERLQNLIDSIAKEKGKNSKEIVEEIVSEIPAGRLGKPSEIAYIITFLASRFADYVNGINLPVDGGYLRTL